MKGQARYYRLALVAIAILIVLVILTSRFYSDWLWFQNLGFSSVFLTMLFSKILIGLIAALVFLLAVGINYFVARRSVKKTSPVSGGGIPLEGLPVTERGARWAIGIFLIVIALMIGSSASAKWSMILRYFHPKSFGISDPIFGRDVAFYVFSLPFYLLLKNWLIGFIVFSGLITILVYRRGNLITMEMGTIQAQDQKVQLPTKFRIDSPARNHLFILGMIIAALLIGGYWLKAYLLMYSTGGPAFGASYTDIHVQLVAYRILMVVLGAFIICLAILNVQSIQSLYRSCRGHKAQSLLTRMQNRALVQIEPIWF